MIFDGNKIVVSHVGAVKLHQPQNFQIECAVYRNQPPNGFVTLAYVLEGMCEYKYEHKSIIAGEGDIVYLDYYNPFKQKVLEDYRVYNINFRIDSGFLKEPDIFRPDQQDKYLLKFKKIVQVCREKKTGYLLSAIGILYQILGDIQFDLAQSDYRGTKQRIFTKAKVYIGENLSNPALTTEAVANMADISPGYLRTIFKEFTSMTASAYIKEARINYGAALLQSGDYCVGEIANRCGFLNVSHFIKEFKAQLGCTPLKYKRNVKEVFYSRREGKEDSKLAKDGKKS